MTEGENNCVGRGNNCVGRGNNCVGRENIPLDRRGKTPLVIGILPLTEGEKNSVGTWGNIPPDRCGNPQVISKEQYMLLIELRNMSGQ